MQHLGLWTGRAAWGHVCTQCSVWPLHKQSGMGHVCTQCSVWPLHKQSGMCMWLLDPMLRLGHFTRRAARAQGC